MGCNSHNYGTLSRGPGEEGKDPEKKKETVKIISKGQGDPGGAPSSDSAGRRTLI